MKQQKKSLTITLHFKTDLQLFRVRQVNLKHKSFTSIGRPLVASKIFNNVQHYQSKQRFDKHMVGSSTIFNLRHLHSTHFLQKHNNKNIRVRQQKKYNKRKALFSNYYLIICFDWSTPSTILQISDSFHFNQF